MCTESRALVSLFASEVAPSERGVYLLNNGSGVHFDTCVCTKGYDTSLSEGRETAFDGHCSMQAVSGCRRRALRASIVSVPAILLNTIHLCST